jgi:antitoxin component YwqK of YwqJK toxin-antitoxin module
VSDVLTKEIKKRFHENGTLIEEDEYVGGLRHGVRRLWSPSGTLMGQAQYHNGRLSGKCLSWHENGARYVESAYTDHMLDGPYRSYWDNGNPKEKGEYRHGLRLAGYQWFDSSGTLTGTSKEPVQTVKPRNERHSWNTGN